MFSLWWFSIHHLFCVHNSWPFVSYFLFRFFLFILFVPMKKTFLQKTLQDLLGKPVPSFFLSPISHYKPSKILSLVSQPRNIWHLEWEIHILRFLASPASLCYLHSIFFYSTLAHGTLNFAEVSYIISKVPSSTNILLICKENSGVPIHIIHIVYLIACRVSVCVSQRRFLLEFLTLSLTSCHSDLFFEKQYNVWGEWIHIYVWMTPFLCCAPETMLVGYAPIKNIKYSNIIYSNIK